jgi:tetratricopeptide (TPR) repeat protein
MDGQPEALTLYLAADYDACIEVLQGERGVERDLLLARTYLRTNRVSDAEAVLADSPARGKSLWCSLMGASQARLGEPAKARELFDEASDLAQTPEECAEARYQRALFHWIRQEYEKAEGILDAGDFGGVSGRAAALRAHLWALRGDYERAMLMFEQSAVQSGDDRLIECDALWNAALYARELYEPGMMRSVLQRARDVTWTPHLKLHRYHITRNAGWLSAIEGEYIAAMRAFSSAASLHVDHPWPIFALADRAYFSLLMGETVNGWATAEEALSLARSVDWAKVTLDEHVVLLYLAGIFAYRSPHDARLCREQYASVAAPRDAMRSTWHRTLSIRAWEAFTDGLLASSMGEVPRAAREFTKAFSMYRRIGFGWRAVLTLLAMREIGVSRPGYDEYVRATLQRFPNSWLKDLAEREFRKSAVPLVAAA